MKKVYIIAMAFGAMCLMPARSEAQILKNILSSVVSSVTGGTTISTSNLQGTWKYSSPAVSLQSDNILTSAVGTAATSQVEKKLSTYYKKLGITASNFNYTFNSDSTFTNVLRGKTLSGTYSIDSENKTITLNYALYGTISLGSLTASVELSGSTLSLLFEADKVLKLITAASALTNNSTLNTLNTLISQYDGMKMGYKLTK
jgi:hypothetical protein